VTSNRTMSTRFEPLVDGVVAAADSVLSRFPGYRAVRFARMAGSSIAQPDAAGWVTDFLNAAYYARPREARDVDDLRLAFCIVTTRWHGLARRLRVFDVAPFHRAFGIDRFLERSASPWGTLSREQLVEGGARLLGDWFPAAYANRERRAWGVAFAAPRAQAEYEPEARLREAALGALTPPRVPPAEQQWSTYPPVALPSLGAGLRALSDPRRWPDFGSELGRFTPLRSGGLDGQTFEIEVVAHFAPRTPVFTRAYVTATRRLDDADAIDATLADARAHLAEPPLPDGATPRLLLELTTHEGHFLGPAISRILVYEDEAGAWVRDIGAWDPLPLHLAAPFKLAGRAAQHAFWGGGNPEQSMLHQLALAAS
jgi:hypothetical protein